MLRYHGLLYFEEGDGNTALQLFIYSMICIVVCEFFSCVNFMHRPFDTFYAMGLRRKLAATLLTLCGGGAVAGAAFYALRSRQTAITQPVATPTNGDLTLKNVQIFFRHGARTPLTNVTGLDEVRVRKCRVFVYIWMAFISVKKRQKSI